jgi:hypothetical protein
VQGLRRELEGFAQRCRAFADVCEETSRRIEGLVHPPAPRKVPEPKAVRAQDTLPELGAFDIMEVEVSLDWSDEDEPTAIWVQAKDPALTWEQPVVSGARRSPTVPPPVMRPCPSCGHGNGLQYHCCTACGCRLTRADVAQQLEETVVLQPTLGSRVRGWIRRMDPRRPRWLDPDVLEAIEMPAMH